MKTFPTVEGKIYCVNSTTECTILSQSGTLLGTAFPGTPFWFQAQKGDTTTLSDDAAEYSAARFSGALIAAGAGGGGVAASGEKIIALTSNFLTITHATWFDNASQSTIAVHPGAVANRVLTCYLKTDIPVALSGVTWLYGEPFMDEGYTYVIALQQISSETVLANLAYSLKQ